MNRKLCLASVGAYSCFKPPTEGIDEDGDGYCIEHAAFLRMKSGTSILCAKCAYIMWDDVDTIHKSAVGHWAFDPQCIRCGGSGKETLL